MAVPAWLLCAVIAASTTALLGTSEPVDAPTSPDISPAEPTIFTTYPFARNAIDGGAVELTEAAPTATFYVTITATDLGPNGVQSTTQAVVDLHGLVTTSDLSKGTLPPLVSIQVSSPDSAGSVSQTLDEFAPTQALQFTGDCAAPKNRDCRARFAVALRRLDDGAAGGTVAVNWSFDLESAGQLAAATASTMDTRDPPWTVQVTAP